jgi:SPP1 family predicted phage head-tail adaptor
MRAGKLRHLVTVQEELEDQSSMTGAVTKYWATIATVYASVDPMLGRELQRAMAERAELTYAIRLRYMPGLTPRNRILYDGRTFNIRSVVDVEERHRELVVTCTEGLNNG